MIRWAAETRQAEIRNKSRDGTEVNTLTFGQHVQLHT